MSGNSERDGARRTDWRDHTVTIAINAVLLAAVIYALVALLDDRSASHEAISARDGSTADDDTATSPTISPSSTTAPGTASPSPDPAVGLLGTEYSPGRCYSWDQDRTWSDVDEVPCADTHHAQSIGPVTAPETADDEPPSDAWLSEKLQPQCEALAVPYLEIGRFGSAFLEPRWSLIEPESWRVGTRRTTCYIGFVDGAGASVPVTAAMPAPTL